MRIKKHPRPATIRLGKEPETKESVYYKQSEQDGGTLVVRGDNDAALSFNALLMDGFLGNYSSHILASTQSPFTVEAIESPRADLFKNPQDILFRGYKESEKQKKEAGKPGQNLTLFYKLPSKIDDASRLLLSRILFDSHKTSVHTIVNMTASQSENFFALRNPRFLLHNVHTMYVMKSALPQLQSLDVTIAQDIPDADVVKLTMNKDWTRAEEVEGIDLTLPSRVNVSLVPDSL